MIVLPGMDTGEELNTKAVPDDEDGSADNEECVEAEVETIELDSVPVVPEFAIDDEEPKLDDIEVDKG